MLEHHTLATEFLDVSYEAWTLLIAAFNLVVVIIAALLGLRQLTALAKGGRFNGAVEFQQLTRNHEKSIWRIVDEFPVVADMRDLDSVDPDLLQHARLVVNSLNDVGQLVEEGLIEPKIYFGLMHGQVLRLVFLLQPFLRWEEGRIGGRYGRRLLRMQARARRYHDICPIHRRTVVTLPRADKLHEVYRTVARTGIRGGVQRLGWSLRLLLRRF